MCVKKVWDFHAGIPQELVDKPVCRVGFLADAGYIKPF